MLLHTEFLGSFMIYLRTKYHILRSSDSLIIAIRHISCGHGVSILQFVKVYHNKRCSYFEDL